jgi:phospholipid/cholesterol/gamma-HCH transport system substrate-binding protein
MFRNQNLELRVGLFIGVGIFVMFMLVFSISDMRIFNEGYPLHVIFDYVNGVTANSPVRLAGVHVGEVKSIDLFYDVEEAKTKVRVDLWITGNTRVQKDAVARINTLGLLGEQYVELSPGVSPEFLENDAAIIGRNPINVGEQMERMSDMADSVSGIMTEIGKGEGTLGKLLTDDTLYNDLEAIFGRLKRGEGTLGKLLVEEKVYDDMEDFVGDIKANPWKLLHKTSDRGKRSDDSGDARGTVVEPRR